MSKQKDIIYTERRALLQAKCEKWTERNKRSSFRSCREILKDMYGFPEVK